MSSTLLTLNVFVNALYRWLRARLQWLQCVSNGVTAVLHWATDVFMNSLTDIKVMQKCFNKAAILFSACILQRSLYMYNLKALNRAFSQLSFLQWWPAEQLILANKSEQPTASCIAIFHKYVCYVKHRGITTNLTMKSLGVCYWYIKMPQCGCVEHGLEYTTFYVQKHIAHLAALFWFPAGSRRVARGACICETPLLPVV